jgi:hypothetical protein
VSKTSRSSSETDRARRRAAAGLRHSRAPFLVATNVKKILVNIEKKLIFVVA